MAPVFRACPGEGRGPRWRRAGAGDGDNVRPLPLSAQALCRWRLQREDFPEGREAGDGQSLHRNRQAQRRGQGLRRPAQAMDCRTLHRLAQP